MLTKSQISLSNDIQKLILKKVGYFEYIKQNPNFSVDSTNYTAFIL